MQGRVFFLSRRSAGLERKVDGALLALGSTWDLLALGFTASLVAVKGHKLGTPLAVNKTHLGAFEHYRRRVGGTIIW